MTGTRVAQPRSLPNRQFVAAALAIVFALCLFAAPSPAQAGASASLVLQSEESSGGPPPDVRLANEYIAIIVNAGEQNTARFAVETTGGDPDRTSDDNSPLIYKVPGQSPWTSYATIRIDGIDYVFGGPTNERAGRAGLFGEQIFAPRLVDGNRIESAYRIGPLEVTQSLSIIRSTTTGLLDTVRIAYLLRHVGTAPVTAGLRLMLDTMLGQNDGAPFRVGESAITSDTVFTGEQIPEFWQAFDSLSDPRVTAQGNLRGRDITTPDRVYFSNWGAFADGLWEFSFEPNRDFTRLGEFSLDSATAMYWDPQRLAPGETREYVVHYGLGGISISPGQLSLGVTSPASVTASPDQEVTFPVVAYIQNNGEGEARDAVARITLPAGLKPAAGESLVRPLGSLPPGRTAQVTWRIALDRAIGGELTYSVRVEAINAEPNEVSRRVEIVAPAQLSIELVEPNGRLRVVQDRWEPLPYEVAVNVTNTGGSDAENVVLRWETALAEGLELAPGDQAEKPIGPLASGERYTLRWHIRPQTTSSAERAYPFVGNLPFSVKGTVSGQSEEYRADGFLDVPPLASALKVVTATEGEVRVGDYVMVELRTQNVRSFYGADVLVRYDPRRLQLVGGPLGVDRGRLFVDESASNGGGPRLLSWTTPEHVVDPGGSSATVRIRGERRGASNPTLFWVSDTLASLRFRVLQGGTHNIEIVEARVYDREGQAVTVQRVNGQIAVRGQ